MNGQELAVWLIVAAAALYLARAIWRTVKTRKRGCGACASCPSEAQAAEPNVVELTPTRRTTPH